MSEILSQNPDPSPNRTTDWSVFGGGYDKETDINQAANPETTSGQFKGAVRGVIATREELISLSEQSEKNPEDDGARQAARWKAVELQRLIEQRNELAKKIVNDRPVV